MAIVLVEVNVAGLPRTEMATRFCAPEIGHVLKSDKMDCCYLMGGFL